MRRQRIAAAGVCTFTVVPPPVLGRPAHRAYIEAGLRREPRRRLTLTSIRGEQFGDVFCDSGRWTNTVTSSDDSERSFGGYYSTVYRREQGAWKVLTATFNLDP